METRRYSGRCWLDAGGCIGCLSTRSGGMVYPCGTSDPKGREDRDGEHCRGVGSGRAAPPGGGAAAGGASVPANPASGPAASRCAASARADCQTSGQTRSGLRVHPPGPSPQAGLCRGAQQPGDCPPGTGQAGGGGRPACGRPFVSSRTMPRRTTTWGMPSRIRASWRKRRPACSRPSVSSRTMPRRTTTWGLPSRTRASLEEAAASLQQAVRLKPNYAEAHTNLGNGPPGTGQAGGSGG